MHMELYNHLEIFTELQSTSIIFNGTRNSFEFLSDIQKIRFLCCPSDGGQYPYKRN